MKLKCNECGWSGDEVDVRIIHKKISQGVGKVKINSDITDFDIEEIEYPVPDEEFTEIEFLCPMCGAVIDKTEIDE